MDITQYKTIVFDCDGVILDSNPLKIQAYYDTAIHQGYSEAQAQALVKYHVELGGISRYHKFEYFLREIVRKPVVSAELQALIERFSYEVKQALIHCEMAAGLAELREATPNAGWMLVSGGDQSEKREVFAARSIDTMFDAGIFGSPDYKDDILAREAVQGKLQKPGLFVGDSRYANIDVPIAAILAEVSPGLGLEPRRVEPCRSMRASPQQGGRPELAESLVVLERR